MQFELLKSIIQWMSNHSSSIASFLGSSLIGTIVSIIFDNYWEKHKLKLKQQHIHQSNINIRQENTARLNVDLTNIATNFSLILKCDTSKLTEKSLIHLNQILSRDIGILDNFVMGLHDNKYNIKNIITYSLPNLDKIYELSTIISNASIDSRLKIQLYIFQETYKKFVKIRKDDINESKQKRIKKYK